MKKTIAFDLTVDDIDKVEISFRFITDRTTHPSYYKDGKHYVEPFNNFQRKDIFWVDLTLDGEDLGPLAIDPIDIATFRFSRNYCKVNLGYMELLARINTVFMSSEYYHKQIAFMTKRKTLDERSKQLGFTEPLELYDYQKLFETE